MIEVTLISVAFVSMAFKILSATVRSCLEVVLIAKILLLNVSGTAGTDGAWAAAEGVGSGVMVIWDLEPKERLVVEAQVDDEPDHPDEEDTRRGNGRDLRELLAGGCAREL